MPENKELISEIQKKIQFLVTIEIFFLTLMRGLLPNDNKIWIWGIGIAFCILNYLLVENMDRSKSGLLILVHRSVSFNTYLFILPVVLLILIQQNLLPSHYILPFQLSLQGTLWMPLVTSVLIMAGLSWSEISTFIKTRKR